MLLHAYEEKHRIYGCQVFEQNYVLVNFTGMGLKVIKIKVVLTYKYDYMSIILWLSRMLHGVRRDINKSEKIITNFKV